MGRGKRNCTSQEKLYNSRIKNTAEERGYIEQAIIALKLYPKFGQPEKPSGWTVALAEDCKTKEEVKLVGTFGPVSEGQLIAIKNDFNKPPPWIRTDWGWEYKVWSLDHSDPLTREALESYLRHLPGVGTQLAKAIIETFKKEGSFDGQEILARLDEDPTLLRQVKSQHGHKIQAEWDDLINMWQDLRKERKEMLFFSSLGFGDSFTKRVREHFLLQNIDPIEATKANPYVLTEVEDVGFKAADSAAKGLGIAFDDPRRLIAGLSFVLGEAKERQSHICLPRDILLKKAPYILTRDHRRPQVDLIETALAEALKQGRLVSYTDETDSVERIYTREMYIVETRLYDKLDKLLREEKLEPPKSLSLTKPEGSMITDEQWQATVNCFQERISILTGAPGVGKTFALKNILDVLDQQNQTYLCMSPTGKAAKRMKELTGREAMTIHRAMMKESYIGLTPPKSVDEEITPEHKLNYSVIIVDEASMLDAELAERLISHMGDKTRLVLVGDPDQLPPVGAGAVLFDLLAADRVPTTKLTKIFRQAEDSLLVVNAHRIKDGFEPYWTAKEAEQALGHPLHEDFHIFECGTSKAVSDEVINRVGNLASSLQILPADVLVASPFHKGKCGVDELNQRLQELNNPHGEEIRKGKEPLRVGDWVMNTKNRYARRDDGSYDVMNGDTGEIISWDAERKSAAINFGSGIMSFSGEDLAKVVPAYAATVHKLQGSQGPGVIMPLANEGASWLISRNHIYTGLTRAEEECVMLVDSKDTLKDILSRVFVRETTLDLRIGRVEKRIKASWEVILDCEARWQKYTRERKLPRRGRISPLAS